MPHFMVDAAKMNYEQAHHSASGPDRLVVVAFCRLMTTAARLW
jgi:hypothetical protein